MQLTKGCKRKVRELLSLADSAFQACRDAGDRIRELDSQIVRVRRELATAEQTLADQRSHLICSGYPAEHRDNYLQSYAAPCAKHREKLTDLIERRDDLRLQLDTHLTPMAQRAGAVSDSLKKYLQVSGEDLEVVSTMPGMGGPVGFFNQGGSPVSRGGGAA